MKEWKDDYELNRWLKNKAESSVVQYLLYWGNYLDYVEQETGKRPTSKELIDEIEEDQTKSRRHKGEIARRLVDWHRNLIEEGSSENYAKTRIGAIMGFYRSNGFKIAFTERFSDLFPAGGREDYRKRLLKPEDVKLMLDYARCLRDKAIILTLYEGGMDIKTLCSMNAGHLKKADGWATIHLYRTKEKWSYFTHLGTNALTVIRRYLKERGKAKDDDPLFVAIKNKRIRQRNVQDVVKDIASRCGLADGDLRVIPYCLRSSFETLLETDGCSYEYKEFWMGHKIKYRGAYFIPTEELSLKTYQEHYNCLNIEKTESADIEQFRRLIADQTMEIDSLKAKIKNMEEKQTKSVNARIEELEETVRKLVRIIKEEGLKKDIEYEV